MNHPAYDYLTNQKIIVGMFAALLTCIGMQGLAVALIRRDRDRLC